MRVQTLLAVVVVVLTGAGREPRAALPVAVPNSNTTPAGELRDGVLRIALDATLAMWHPDGDSLPGIPIEAFAERGGRPQVPGPLVRVPRGTELRASIRNALERDTLTFHLPSADGTDSVVVPPGETRELRARASAPGTFLYRATTSTPLSRALRVGGLLAGALVVDSSASASAARDRIFVLLAATDSVDPVFGAPLVSRTVRAVNGRSWPHTERLQATVGDTLRWRVINAANDIHPMHLHGFYFRVDAFDGPRAAEDGQGAPGRWVVTERMSPFSTMSLTWVPERAGNWLFHCHFQKHVAPHGPLGGTGPDGTPQRIGLQPARHDGDAHANHALTAMAGLAVGVEVRPRATGVGRDPDATRERRRLRLVAVQDSGFPETRPSMRFVLDGRGDADPAGAGAGVSPTIDLTRGEPVEITVVNRLRDPLAVHWHGIELESYFDGVAGFSGDGRRLAPTIAPGDSFPARFTPPRAGTFIYHSHMDEPRHHRAGLVGALVVRAAPAADADEDVLFLIKSARDGADGDGLRPATAGALLEINGRTDPDTVVMRVGRRYRMRFVGMAVGFPNATAWLTARPDSSFANLRDTLVLRWRPVAKDGADLPPAARAPRLARQIVSMGETYDFEFVPDRRGELRLEVRGAGPRARLLVRAPIRVE